MIGLQPTKGDSIISRGTPGSKPQIAWAPGNTERAQRFDVKEHPGLTHLTTLAAVGACFCRGVPIL